MNNDKHPRSFDFDYVPVPQLPSGHSGESIFRSAIDDWRDDRVSTMLKDLYRWLVFGNFATFGGRHKQGARERTLHEMNAAYPYGRALREAASFSAFYHPSGATNTQGAVLYLLLHSQNPEEDNHILGGILMAVLDHKHFNKSGLPTIDATT
jgi:hypothetical protein